MSSWKTSADSGTSQKLHQLGKSVSYDCLKASSCIELADIRKLDSLLNQCESISCDNLLLCDEIYNYDMCTTTKKYLSTSALNRILPKNSIRRRAHKKALGICENDTKIIKLIDDKRGAAASSTSQCNEVEHDFGNNNNNNNDIDDINPTDVELTESYMVNKDELLVTQSCTNLLHEQYPTETSSCCDKTIQTSFGELNHSQKSIAISCKYLLNDDGATMCMNVNNDRTNHPQDFMSTVADRINNNPQLRKVNQKRCQCRKYEAPSDGDDENHNPNGICETSLTTPPTRTLKSTNRNHNQPKKLSTLLPISTVATSHQQKKSLLQLKRDKSPPSSGKSNRFTRQPNTVIYDDEQQQHECSASNLNHNNGDSFENRVININETSIEIIPISNNPSVYSHSLSPKGTSHNLLHDGKSDKSETQSQKSHKSKQRSKFSPSLFSRKLTSRLNSEDEAGGVKESLLGSRGKSSEKKLPEPVETVCIYFFDPATAIGKFVENEEEMNFTRFSVSFLILVNF